MMQYLSFTSTIRFFRFFAVLMGMGMVMACASPSAWHRDVITQTAPWPSSAGDEATESSLPVSALKEYGDTGIGFFRESSSRLLLLNGTAYQLDPSGNVQNSSKTDRVTWALVTPFTMTTWIRYHESKDLEGLLRLLEAELPSASTPVMAVIRGEFTDIQLTPSRPFFKKGSATPKIVPLSPQSGTLLAVRSPAPFSGAAVNEWNVTFLNASQTMGGPVHYLQTSTGDIRIDSHHNAYMILLP